MDLQRLQKQLALEEGCPPKTYYDEKGILTGGIGHNLIDEPEDGFDRVGIPVPQEMVDKWFAKDVQDAIDDLDRNLPWWRDLDDVRQNALLDLVFNMGWGNGSTTGLSSFKNTLNAFKSHEFLRAAEGFRNSQWARDVKAARTKRVTDMIEKGEWQL